VHGEAGELVGDAGAPPRQEAGAHPVGLGAQPKVQARGLDLVGVEGPVGRDAARLEQRRNVSIRKDTAGHAWLLQASGRKIEMARRLTIRQGKNRRASKSRGFLAHR
jgi:hypothetical protein